MQKPKVLRAFTSEELERAHHRLAQRVAFMMGRKFEEGDWSDVYCGAKAIPDSGWSNLHIDIMYRGLGVEHKMLCYGSKPSILEACGETLMHPAATRSIRVPDTDTDAKDAMVDVLTQYAELIRGRAQKVQEDAGGGSPDMRTGWLLWQASLRGFLYFEEEMLAPEPDDYYAKWITRNGSGARKGSTSLWIYERDTGQKRYSVTTSAGAKIQPYFDVPPPNHDYLYHFVVQGEKLEDGLIRVWVTEETRRELQRILGNTDTDALSADILETAERCDEHIDFEDQAARSAHPLLVQQKAYDALRQIFPDSVNDAHLFQMFVEYRMNA